MPGNWSRLEVEAAVAAYFEMLTAELSSIAYSKAESRRSLTRRLESRSDGSIERKHQNISAVLIELGLPYIAGYKPLGNYQALLRGVIGDRLRLDRGFLELVRSAVDAPAPFARTDALLDREEAAPESAAGPGTDRFRETLSDVRPLLVNYLEREARNASLGRAGEEFVVRYEKARLLKLEQPQLAERVEQVSVTVGDGAGFDIRSFEDDGSERLIEVKTTAYGKQTPFFLTKNEVEVSTAERDRFHLYRLFQFRQDPRLYRLRGDLRRNCRLDAVQFRAQPA